MNLNLKLLMNFKPSILMIFSNFKDTLKLYLVLYSTLCITGHNLTYNFLVILRRKLVYATNVSNYYFKEIHKFTNFSNAIYTMPSYNLVP